MKNIIRIFIIQLILIPALFACSSGEANISENDSTTVSTEGEEAVLNTDLPLEKLNVPDGFSISVFAEVKAARSMARASDGTLFVGSRTLDHIWAVKDTDNDGLADKKWKIGGGFTLPNGVALKNGDLYVAEVNRIIRYKDILNNLENPGEPEVIYDDYPTDKHHGWKYIKFGPDGWLYVPVGAPCNICNSENPVYASITRLNVETGEREVYASGIRNTVGFTWHPDTKNLWFTDNGRDHLGDNKPPCELNMASEKGMHFGYPFCHGGTIPDPEFGDMASCDDFTKPVQNLGPHVAPLGLTFITDEALPEEMQGDILIAEHGSWNRSEKIGYRITRVKLENGKAVSYEPFLDGWLDEAEQKAFGRPVDILSIGEGQYLISDDAAGVIYKLSYKG